MSAYRRCFDTSVNRHMKYQNRKTTDRNKVLYILRGILAVPGISMKYFLGKIQFKKKTSDDTLPSIIAVNASFSCAKPSFSIKEDVSIMKIL